jgi:hypothetical protein
MCTNFQAPFFFLSFPFFEWKENRRMGLKCVSIGKKKKRRKKHLLGDTDLFTSVKDGSFFKVD